MRQEVIYTDVNMKEFIDWLSQCDYKTFFMVCGIHSRSVFFSRIEPLLGTSGKKMIWFSDFAPNPEYGAVVRGVSSFRKEKCDCIVAIGGGSAIDVAKCIKKFSGMEGDGSGYSFLHQDSGTIRIPLAVMPTTAGTGSESTQFAVIYADGVKKSVDDPECLPNVVFFNPDALVSLPDYQKKSTVLDALSHAMESFWSVNSTTESKQLSECAIRQIMKNLERYLNGDRTANQQMLMAANTAGRAIQITRTTAGHALCYPLTSKLGIAHGHAAFLCNTVLLPWMNAHVNQCVDRRGEFYLRNTFQKLAEVFGCPSVTKLCHFINVIYDRMEFTTPETEMNEKLMKEMGDAVNVERLNNNPVKLDPSAIVTLYKKMASR